MCELMGLCFERPVSAEFSIHAFSSGDVENADGWGLAWYPDSSLSIVKEAVTWRTSGYSQFLESYQRLLSRIYIAHMRHMTVGIERTNANTHPFSRELGGREYCFAHNGTIRRYRELKLGRFHPIGATDSEHVFCYLLERIARRGTKLDDDDSWRWLEATLAKLNRQGRLNCLLSDGERLFAYRDADGWKGLAIRKVRFRDKAQRLLEDPTMELAVAGDAANHGHVVATRPLSDTGWHNIKPGTLVVLREGSLEFSSQPQHA